MGKLGKIAKFLLIGIGLCIAVSYYAILSPGGSPDRVGSALVLLLGMIGGLMMWSAALVLAILAMRAREHGAKLTLLFVVLALPLALAGFGIAMELSIR
jgi:hypothetical protein